MKKALFVSLATGTLLLAACQRDEPATDGAAEADAAAVDEAEADAEADAEANADADGEEAEDAE